MRQLMWTENHSCCGKRLILRLEIFYNSFMCFTFSCRSSRGLHDEKRIGVECIGRHGSLLMRRFSWVATATLDRTAIHLKVR